MAIYALVAIKSFQTCLWIFKVLSSVCCGRCVFGVRAQIIKPWGLSIKDGSGYTPLWWWESALKTVLLKGEQNSWLCTMEFVYFNAYGWSGERMLSDTRVHYIHTHNLSCTCITDDQRASATPAKDLRVLLSSRYNELHVQVLATHCCSSISRTWTKNKLWVKSPSECP